MRLILAFVIVISFTSSLLSVKEPKHPKVPKVDTKKVSKKKQTNVPVSLKNKERHYSVKAVLANGVAIKGRLRLQYSFFWVKHKVKGFLYHKKIEFGNIRELRIVRWKAVLASERNGKKLYYFMPAIYRISTIDGVTVLLHKRLKLLDSFFLENHNGRTRLFCYFADYWNGTKAKGYWSNSGSSEFTYNCTQPNKFSVSRIFFLKSKSRGKRVIKVY